MDTEFLKRLASWGKCCACQHAVPALELEMYNGLCGLCAVQAIEVMADAKLESCDKEEE